MSSTRNKYPLIIDECKITKDTLHFTVLNNTKNPCNIYVNDTLITKSEKEVNQIKYDISNNFIGRYHIKVETEDNFVIKTVKKDLSNYFSNLKKTLHGLDNIFFLVNDKNEEIRQHYDVNYKCNLDLEKFRRSTLSKKSYLKEKEINYELFVVPDKSITLRNKLPFKTCKPYRHTEHLNDVVVDLGDVINGEDMYLNDTHISSRSSLKIVSYMMSVMDNSSYDEVYSSLEGLCHFERENHLGDLFNFQNWSYDRDELFHDNKYLEVDILHLNNPVESIDLDLIPEDFRHISRRDSLMFRNPDSISSKRAIVLHDSSTLLLMDALTCYYREVFFYWDHWFFNENLVEWFKPDDVLEIRTERFLDNPQYSIVNDEYVAKFPLSAQLKKFNINDETLHASILVKDYRQLPVKSLIKIFIDDVLVCEDESDSFYYDFKYSLKDTCKGDHVIRFEVKSKYKFRSIVKEFVLEDSLEPLFKDLKLTLMGVNDSFFMVNDKTCELRQHYDKMYVPRFNRNRFITSLNSKKKYLEKIGVNYDLFIIPDKSVVLSEFIPFNHESPMRHVNSLKDYLIDLIECVNVDDYLVNDTNVSMCAGLNIVSYILSHMHGKDDYFNVLLERLSVTEAMHRGNLFTKKSWSYPDNTDLRDKYYSVKTRALACTGSVELDCVPDEFKVFSNASSQYFRNDDSLTEYKVLVLCDDSIKPLVASLQAYYREVFLYYDLWYFNKELVSWFNPDDLLEIRAERTLENARYQLVSIEDNFVIPVTRKVEEFSLEDNVLHIRIVYDDLRGLPVKSSCKISVDGKLISTVSIDGLLDVEYSLSGDCHIVEVFLEASEFTKSNVYRKSFGV